MKNEIRIFENPEFGQVRTIELNNEPWFVGKDVAEILGYSNSRKALINHVADEDKTDGVTIRDSIGRDQNPIIINESGLYSLILSSKLPKAKQFKHWVTADVLPSIRKHGMYAADDLLDNPDLMIQIITELKEERQMRKLAQSKAEQLEQDNEKLQPKALFADAVSSSQTSILVGEMAKILKQNGIEMGQNRFFEWLRGNGYLMQNGSSKNLPTQRAMELELFEIKETTRIAPDGAVVINKTPKVTPKGQIYFVNKFLGK